MKTQLVPPVLRPFHQVFEKLAVRHNYVTAFDDYLTAMLNFFTHPQFPGETACFDKYTPEERETFSSLLCLTLKTLQEQLPTENSWFDCFGDFYMLTGSQSKQSGTGQFFTPPHIVDLMVMVQGDDQTGKGIRVSDPACGSGRMLIAFHARFPGNYVFGEDLDLICCKMACLNLLLHGCEGEVVWRNALDPNDYRGGWHINPALRLTGLPFLMPMEKENSLIWKTGQQKRDPVKPGAAVMAEKEKRQLSLF
jgi:type I restriction enzyme M protein